MNKESTLLAGIWSVIEDQIPRGQKVESVIQIMRHLEDYGCDLTDFEEAAEDDPYIEGAYAALVEPAESYKDYDGYDEYEN